MKLSQIYKAKQCTDINDVDMAIIQTREWIKVRQFWNLETAAGYRRLLSLNKRRKELDNEA